MPFQAHALKPLPMNLDVQLSLRESQFVPFFQPLVTLRTGQLAGFEVLARWPHPVEGLIPPSTFIPIAEQEGWLGELTHQILQKAFVAAAAIPHPLTLAINISPVQLRDAALPTAIQALATEAGFPLSRLVIEITESALIDDADSATDTIAQLKQMGCRLALDDFGTGYSSLAHLQALPFDKLKVDRSFVGSMTEKRESRKIVSGVVGLGQSLGLMTVAEGIETQEQAEMMLWLGCDLGQGYFYGRPMSADELPACLSQKRHRLLIHSGSVWRKISTANLELSPTQRLAQLQAVYDGAPVGLAFVDPDLRFVNLNQKLADMNGAKVEDHLGSPIADILPELFPYVEPYIRRALKGEALTDVEVHLPSTRETRLVSYQPVSDEGSEVIGVSIAVTDITERKRAEEALKKSEAYYRSMVDLNPQVLWIMDPMGRNLDVSPRWDKTTGKMKSQSTEHEWLRSVHPDDIRPTVRAIAKSRRDGAPIDVQYRAAYDGGWHWKRSRGAPRFDADGNIVCWYGSVEDIDTPIRRKNDYHRKNGSVDRETTIHLQSPVVFVDKERRRQVLHDLEILDTPPEAEFDDLAALAAEICATPIGLISLIDEERQWFKAAVGLAVSETPIISSFCAHAIAQHDLFMVTDATKDERFEKNELVLGAPHIRFYAGMPLYVGDGVAIGTLCVIDTIPRSLSPSQIKALTILSHQVQARIELRAERRKQSIEIGARQELTRQLEASNKVLIDANQTLKQLYVELEQTQLQHLEDESELRRRTELDNLKSEYVAMVSHELRSPLTSVRGAVGILAAGLIDPGTDKGGKLFQIALSNLDRMIRLVNDALNLERIASGASSLQITECSLEEVVRQAVEAMLPIAQDINIKLTQRIVGEAKESALHFDGDADKMLQVLINLLSNAIKFSPPKGEVMVSIEAMPQWLRVQISDEGRGIPDDQLEKVFERFSQVEQDDARRLGGSGLGLAICRAIVGQHGGSIWAERNPVKGTSFFLNLPGSRRMIASEDTPVVLKPLPLEGCVPFNYQMETTPAGFPPGQFK